jgi:signal transduction histidine kinase
VKLSSTTNAGEAGSVSFDDRVAISRLVFRYAVVALVTLTVVAVATAYASRRLGTDEAIEDATRVTTIAATAAAEPVVTDELVAMDPDAIARVDAAVRRQVLRGSLVRVKIWSSDGTIVYSDEGRLIGQRFELSADLIETLGRGPADVEAEARVSNLTEPENQYEEPAVKLLEVYLPIYTPTGTPLLFEAYFRYEGVVEAGRRAWLRFAPVTLGSLLFLELLQVPLVLSLARRLRRTQEQRELLLHSAIDSADAERRRIASDLHDGVVQDLAGVSFALAATSRAMEGSEREQVSQASDRVRDAVRSLRSLLVEIYPPNLYEEGLEAALSDLMARLDPRGIEATLTLETPVSELPVDIAQLIYRAAQEGLRNVMAHANATRVLVVIARDADRLTLRVIDDGRGFSPEHVPQRAGHLGLRALAGFATTMGAEVIIESEAGKGTELRLEIPVS